MRLMAIRPARREPLALSASGHKRMVNGWAAASGKKGLVCPQESSVLSSEAARVLCCGSFPPPWIAHDHFDPRMPATLTPLPMIRL